MDASWDKLTLWEHLEVLRRVLLKILATLIVTTTVGFLFTPMLYNLLLFPVRNHLAEGELKARFSGPGGVGWPYSDVGENGHRYPPPETGKHVSSTAADLERNFAIPETRFAVSGQPSAADASPGTPAGGEAGTPADNQSLDARLEVYEVRLAELADQVRQLSLWHPDNTGVRIIYSSPVQPFTVKLKIAFLGGFFFAIPFICHFLWGFVRPALGHDEKGLVLKSTVASTLLFILGASLGYAFLPLGIPALLTFSASGVGHIWPFTVYIGFCTKMILAFGLVFEMPVLARVLGRLGLVERAWLAKGRPYAIAAVFFLAALLTPPDVISQIALAIPMLLLYEISIRLIPDT